MNVALALRFALRSSASRGDYLTAPGVPSVPMVRVDPREKY